jgi:hypothetical protein
MIDGQSFDQHYEPFQLAARNMWKDIESYQTYGHAGHIAGNVDTLRVTIPRI